MKRVVNSTQAPAAIGPYSQAVLMRDVLYLSGQIALDPATGQIVAGDIVAETEQVLNNLQAVLEAGGSSFEHVVKTTIYLVDLADFARVNEVYGRRFTHVPPARATVQVAALPRGARVEIDAIAYTR
jgi:2-iminobutanoate/2-iminopropanoate deaminase